LLRDAAFGHIGGFLLGDCFMQRGVERLAGGINLFQPGFHERGLQLLLDHHDAGLQGRIFIARGVRGGQRHFKIIEHGQNFLKQRRVGVLDGLGAFARGAFLVIFQVGGGALFAHFDRGMESQADADGVALTTRAGIDPHGLPSFFQVLLDQLRNGTNSH